MVRNEAGKRIYATTDKARGALKTLADAEGYETFVVPDNVGWKIFSADSSWIIAKLQLQE